MDKIAKATAELLLIQDSLDALYHIIQTTDEEDARQMLLVCSDAVASISSRVGGCIRDIDDIEATYNM